MNFNVFLTSTNDAPQANGSTDALAGSMFVFQFLLTDQTTNDSVGMLQVGVFEQLQYSQ